MQPPKAQISPDTLHASTDDAHLQMPFPLLADESQNAPVVSPAQDERLDVHLQRPFPLLAEASQNAPVVSPAQDAKAEVHLQILFEASQYDPVDKPEQVALVPHLQTPNMHFSPAMLHVTPSHGYTIR